MVAESSPAASKPMTCEDLWAMARLGAPKISPDGRWVVVPVMTFSLEDNDSETHLWLIASASGSAPRRLTWQKGTHSSPAWSPDSRRLAFVGKRGEDPAQLYLLSLEGGEAEPLTDLPMAVGDPKWFADGRRLAFIASTYADLDDDFEAVKERLEERKEDKTQAKVCDTRLLRYWDQYRTDDLVPHIFLLDLDSRKVRDAMPGHDGLLGFGSFQWDLSPDGKEVAFTANGTPPPWQDLRFDLFLLSLEDGEIRNVTGKESDFDMGPVYSPDGRYLIFGRNSRPEISSDFTRLARYDRQTGDLVLLAADWDGEACDWRFTPDARTVLFVAQDRGKQHLYSLPISGGTPRLEVRGGQISAAHAGGGRVVFLAESISRPAELEVIELDDGGKANGRRRLSSWNDERIASLAAAAVEDVTFAGADDDPVQMFVLHPPNFDPGKKWPLLVLIHGGPHSAFLDSFHYRWNAQLFASPGYVVALVNFHGSTGCGQEFADSIVGAHAEKPFIDVMKATDVLLARGYIDEQRMAAAGGSFGGYMTSWILGHSDRYAALVSHAAVYDLMAQFASDYNWHRSESYGAEPWGDPCRIDLWSPSRYAEHFSTPTLVLHGELDYRVPVTQGINLYHVLIGKGVPARVVIFPKENHWVLKPQSARLWWREVFAWLDKYIGRGPG